MIVRALYMTVVNNFKEDSWKEKKDKFQTLKKLYRICEQINVPSEDLDLNKAKELKDAMRKKYPMDVELEI